MSRWSRIKAPLAALAAAGFLGAAVVAPLALPTSASADGEALAMNERIYQEFVPNDSPEADLVFTEVPIDVSTEERQRVEAEAAAKKKAEEAAKSQEQSDQSGTSVAPPKYSGGGTPAEWMAAAGIPEADWGYVDAIVSRESGWNPNATNASSGACGLVQINPCSKVANGYDPVENLIWGHGYAQSRYGGWANAYNSWMAQHWW